MQSPRDDAAAVHVNDGRQIHEPVSHRDIGDVDAPHLIGPCDAESPEQIGHAELGGPTLAQVAAGIDGRDDCIEQLVAYLFRITEWYDTTIRRWFTATLFPFIDLANLCGCTDHRWANYLGLRNKAIDIEQRIAEEFVSPEQLAVFRDEVFAMSWDFSLTQRSHAQIIERLRSVVVAALQGNALNVPSLRDIVDFMRKHDAQFPEFRHSATYKLFEPPIFENKKQAHGYFF